MFGIRVPLLAFGVVSQLLSAASAAVDVYAQTVSAYVATSQVLSWDYSTQPTLTTIKITLENSGLCGFTQATTTLSNSLLANSDAFPPGTLTGSLLWSIPSITPGGCYFIRVSDTQTSASWVSTNKGRGFFTILAGPSPPATVSPTPSALATPSPSSSPSVPVVYVYSQTSAAQLGTQQVLSWDYSKIPSLSKVTITLENTGGCGFSTPSLTLASQLVANVGAFPVATLTGSLGWTIPTNIPAGSCYYIRVSDSTSSSSWVSTNKGRGFMTFIALPPSPSATPSPSSSPSPSGVSSSSLTVNFLPIYYIVAGAPFNLIWSYSGSSPFTSVDVLLLKPDNSEIILLSNVASVGGSIYNVAYPIVPKGTVTVMTNGFKYVLRANNAAQTKYVTGAFSIYP